MGTVVIGKLLLFYFPFLLTTGLVLIHVTTRKDRTAICDLRAHGLSLLVFVAAVYGVVLTLVTGSVNDFLPLVCFLMPHHLAGSCLFLHRQATLGARTLAAILGSLFVSGGGFLVLYNIHPLLA